MTIMWFVPEGVYSVPLTFIAVWPENQLSQSKSDHYNLVNAVKES